MSATEPESRKVSRAHIYYWLTIAVILLAALQLIYFFWHLQYYRNPFRDEAYVHLLLGIVGVAGITAWRWLDTHNSKDGQPRFGLSSLLRAMPPLAAAYIAVIVWFLTIMAAYATQPSGTAVEGFSKTSYRLFSFGAAYFLLAALLLIFAFPLMTAVMIQLKDLALALRKRIKRRGLSLILTIILPVVSYLVLIPVCYDLMIVTHMDPDSGPPPDWVHSLPYFSPITWLENPNLSLWLLPFGILLTGWSFLNAHIIRKHLKVRQVINPT